VSFMLGGDLELSIVMTFCSTLAAVGFMPFWLWLLTREYTNESLTVPFAQIALGLVVVIIPTFIGILAQFKAPRIAKFFESIIPQFGAIAVAVALGTGVYSNFYLLFFPWQTFLCGFLLPFCGFCCGYTFSSILRIEQRYRITICVETGIQNAVLSTAIATLAFTAPFSDEVIAVPLFAALFTGSQTLIAVGLYTLYKRQQRKTHQYVEGEELESTSGSVSSFRNPVGSRLTGFKKPAVPLHYHALADEEENEGITNGKS